MKLHTLGKNQTVVETPQDIAFFSYDKTIAVYDKETKTLTDYNLWDFSKTTAKYFKMFINDYTHFTYDTMAQWRKELSSNMDICTKN